MWDQTILVICVALLPLSPSFGGISENWPIVLIHHEEAAYEYFMETHEHLDGKYLDRFKDTDKVNRKNACLQYLVDAVSFSSHHQKHYVTNDFQGLVERTFQASDCIVENLTFKSASHGELEAPAHICISSNDTESWAISPGFHEDVYFVLNKPVDSVDFHLLGQLEKVPPGFNWTNDSMMSLLELEKMYTNWQFTRSRLPKDKPTPVPSVCDLSMNKIFRLCAVAKVAQRYGLAHLKYDEGHFISQDIPVDYRCIKSQIITKRLPLKNKQPNKPIPAEFVSCAIDKEWKYVDFFVTSDPYSVDSVFTAEALWMEGRENHEIYDEIRGFRLLDHLTDVKVLKSFDEN